MGPPALPARAARHAEHLRREGGVPVEAPLGLLSASAFDSVRDVAAPGAATSRPRTRAGAFFAIVAVSSVRASTMMTPPNPRDRRAPMRSKAVADRITTGDSIGGT